MKKYTKKIKQDRGREIDIVEVSLVEYGIETKKEYTKGMAVDRKKFEEQRIQALTEELETVPFEEKYYPKIKYFRREIEKHQEILDEINEVCELLNI